MAGLTYGWRYLGPGNAMDYFDDRWSAFTQELMDWRIHWTRRNMIEANFRCMRQCLQLIIDNNARLKYTTDPKAREILIDSLKRYDKAARGAAFDSDLLVERDMPDGRDLAEYEMFWLTVVRTIWDPDGQLRKAMYRMTNNVIETKFVDTIPVKKEDDTDASLPQGDGV